MVCKRIKLLRETKNMTQKEVAEALDMPKSTYAHYEDGSNEPKISVLIKIADYYNVSVDWLVGAETEEQKSSPPKNKWEALEDYLETLNDSELSIIEAFIEFLHWRRYQKD